MVPQRASGASLTASDGNKKRFVEVPHASFFVIHRAILARASLARVYLRGPTALCYLADLVMATILRAPGHGLTR